MSATSLDTDKKEATDLGELILRLNPYTNMKIPNTDRSTGDMDIYLLGHGSSRRSINDVELEMEGPYAQEWSFKGQPQKVGMAVRVKYRYAVNDKDGNHLFWVEDYLLIGYQGSMGG